MLPAITHARGSRSLSHAEILAEFDVLAPRALTGFFPIHHQARATVGSGIIRDLSRLLPTQSEWSSTGAPTQLGSTPWGGSHPSAHQHRNTCSVDHRHHPLAPRSNPLEQQDGKENSANGADDEGFGGFVRPASVAMATVSSWSHPLDTTSASTAMASLGSAAWDTPNYTTSAAATNDWGSIGMQADTSSSGIWDEEPGPLAINTPTAEVDLSGPNSPLPPSSLPPSTSMPISPCDQTANNHAFEGHTTRALDNQLLTQERAESSSVASSTQDYTEIIDTWTAGLSKAKVQLQETVDFLLELQSYNLTPQQLSQLLQDHSKVLSLLQGTMEIHAFAQRVHQSVVAHKDSLNPKAVLGVISYYAACQKAFDQLRSWLQEHKTCLGSALADHKLKAWA
ncbi:hypothetical protein H4R35_002132 [Dimargaris xerosporica]|nr:hypothetical protein H4R35_002132 [Dimargaris xerosporica]